MSETKSKAESSPTKDSVLKKDPLPVIEVPPKKVVLVKENSKEEELKSEQEKQTESEMEVDPQEDVISPSAQT
jgi:hypothetical protein